MAKCLCRACEETFTSVGAFDRHRTGSYGNAIYKGQKFIYYEKPSRRCLTCEEMKEKGLLQRENGAWGGEKWEDAGAIFPRFAKVSG